MLLLTIWQLIYAMPCIAQNLGLTGILVGTGNTTIENPSFMEIQATTDTNVTDFSLELLAGDARNGSNRVVDIICAF